MLFWGAPDHQFWMAAGHQILATYIFAAETPLFT